jgi:hypothetical protein
MTVELVTLGSVITNALDTELGNTNWRIDVTAGGYITTSGTPASTQLAVFTDADTVEGVAGLVWDADAFSITGDLEVSADTTLAGNANVSGTLEVTGNLTASADIIGGGNFSLSGNIVVNGTVDGRDVAADGSKLDGIEANATADLTGAEIETLIDTELGSTAWKTGGGVVPVEDDGVEIVASPSALNFTGTGVTVTDVSGVATIAITGGGSGTVDVVSNVATDTILGRITAGSGDSEELTPAQVRTLINVADGADVSPVTSVAGEVGVISDSDLRTALNVEDGATADQTGAEIEALLDVELGGTTWKTGGGTVPVEDDGTEIVATPTAFNFTGTGVSVTDVGGVATINITGGGSPSIQEEVITINAADPHVDIDVSGAYEVAIHLVDLTRTTGGTFEVHAQASTDGGTTFLNTAGDYHTGILFDQFSTTNDSDNKIPMSAGRLGPHRILLNGYHLDIATMPAAFSVKSIDHGTGDDASLLTASLDTVGAVDTIRVFPDSGTFSGGTVYVQKKMRSSGGGSGNTILNGAIDPTTEGVDGDFYINTVTNTLFGPKDSGAWPAGVSLIGPAGSDGNDGAPGADGAVGPQGPQGPAGPQGDPGADGATGPQGPAGPQGDPGADGATGPQGPAGPTGATGPQGPAGADGADGTTLPSIQSGDAGKALIVNQTEDGYEYGTVSSGGGTPAANPWVFDSNNLPTGYSITTETLLTNDSEDNDAYLFGVVAEPLPDTGQHYWELHLDGDVDNSYIGLVDGDHISDATSSSVGTGLFENGMGWWENGGMNIDGSSSSVSGIDYANSGAQVLQFAWDADTNTLEVGLNGTFSSSTFTRAFPADAHIAVNLRQITGECTLVTAEADFAHTIPVGFAALQQPASSGGSSTSALNDLTDVDATNGVTGHVLTQQGDGSFALEAVPAATPTPETFRYWRLLFTEAAPNGWDAASLNNVQFRTSVGGANAATGGTPSVDSTFGGGDASANVFDDNSGTNWSGVLGSLSAGTSWCQYDFGEGNEVWIAEFTIESRSGGDGARTPVGYTLQYSEDGTNWNDAEAITGGSAFGSAEVRTHAVVMAQPLAPLMTGTEIIAEIDESLGQTDWKFTPPLQTFRYWRLFFTEMGNNFDAASLANVEFRTVEDGPNAATGGTPSIDSAVVGTAADVFDGNSGTVWSAVTGSITAGTSWCKYDFGAGNDTWIVQYLIEARSAGDGARTPRGFKLQYSDDDLNWYDADVVTGEPEWTGSEVRTFNTKNIQPVDVSLGNLNDVNDLNTSIGDVLTVQADGTYAFEPPSGGSLGSLTDVTLPTTDDEDIGRPFGLVSRSPDTYGLLAPMTATPVSGGVDILAENDFATNNGTSLVASDTHLYDEIYIVGYELSNADVDLFFRPDGTNPAVWDIERLRLNAGGTATVDLDTATDRFWFGDSGSNHSFRAVIKGTKSGIPLSLERVFGTRSNAGFNHAVAIAKTTEECRALAVTFQATVTTGRVYIVGVKQSSQPIMAPFNYTGTPAGVETLGRFVLPMDAKIRSGPQGQFKNGSNNSAASSVNINIAGGATIGTISLPDTGDPVVSITADTDLTAGDVLEIVTTQAETFTDLYGTLLLEGRE